MTGEREDRQILAAEYALGVLDGQDLAEAQRALSAEAEFRAEVERWAARFAPLLDEIEPAKAPPGLWSKIERAVADGGRAAVNDNAVDLRRSLGRWRFATAGATALAASLAILLLAGPRQLLPPTAIRPPPATAVAAPPMVAMLGDERGTKIVANWDPRAKRLVLAAAADMPADPGRAHELWVIPAGAAPRSLGTMPADKAMHMDFGDAIANLLRAGATIAISVEPPGGSPTGAPTGPVIASGTLESA